MTDGQSVSMSWWSELVKVEVTLRMTVNRSVCRSVNLHQAFMFHVFYSSAFYVQYIQSLFQSRFGSADCALLVTINSNYHSSLDTWTVVLMISTKFKPFIFSVWGFALSNIAYKSKSHYYWRLISQYVKVSSPLWDFWADNTFCPKVVFWKLLSCLCGAPFLMRGRVCHLSFSVCSNLPVFTSSIYVPCVLQFSNLYTSYYELKLPQ
jgi:hypothetical protein